jgi:hypothetical protein
MYGVAQLEGEHRVRPELLEAGAQLGRRQAVLVQPVAPGDAAQHLQLPARQPIAAGQDLPDVRVIRIGRSELPRTPLLLIGSRKNRRVLSLRCSIRKITFGECTVVLYFLVV